MFKWYKNYVKKVWSTILSTKALSLVVIVSNLATVVIYLIYRHQILKTYKEMVEIETESYKKYLEEEAKRRAYSNN